MKPEGAGSRLRRGMLRAAFGAFFLVHPPGPAGAQEPMESLRLRAAQEFASPLQPPTPESPVILVPLPRPAPDPAEEKVLLPPGSLGPPLARVALEPLLNRAWRSPTFFHLDGVPVHVSGTKSRNRSRNWFLGFYSEGWDLPVYSNGRKALRYRALFLPILNGSAELEIRGRRLKVYIQGNFSSRMDSKVVVEPEGKGLKKVQFTAWQIAQASYEAGYPVRLGGREYRILYFQNLLEDERGEFEALSEDRTILFLFQWGRRFYGYPFQEKDTPTEQIGVLTKRVNDGEASLAFAPLTLGLRLRPGRELEVYFPVGGRR